MELPFLKETKWPRIAPPMEEKTYGQSDIEQLEEHCMSELMDAHHAKDAATFRAALMALIVNSLMSQDSGE